MKIPAFITVRSQSSRLPEKCFKSFGEGTVIEHVINRCLYYGLRPIVCTTELACDESIIVLAREASIEFFQGNAINKLMRWRDCARKFNITQFHTIDADDPFFCGEEVNRSFQCLCNGDFDMVCPTQSSSNGGATVGYSLKASAIELACENTTKNTDTEMMWSYMNQLENIRTFVLSEPNRFKITERMTLDYHEDYIFLEAVRTLLGSFASREEIYKLLINNPDLAMINSSRNEEWAKNQKKKLFRE